MGNIKLEVRYDGGKIEQELDEMIKTFFAALGFEFVGSGMGIIDGIRDIGFKKVSHE